MQTLLATNSNILDEIGFSFLKTNWEVDGLIYNMHNLGWLFAFNKAKKALGTCDFSKKTIFISKYFNNDSSLFEDTIKHEIAHAIDFEIRGVSDHSDIWKNIATQIGCSIERTYKGQMLSIGETKYTLKCNVCGFEKPIHRKRKRSVSCTSCCNEHNKGNYTDKFELITINNFLTKN